MIIEKTGETKKMQNSSNSKHDDLLISSMHANNHKRIISEAKDDIQPTLGSIVYCNQGDFEHSGIYIGDDMVIHLNQAGRIEKVSVNDFTSTDYTDIWFPSNDHGQALGLCTAVYVAMEIMDNREDYQLENVKPNQFITGCITNSFENTDNSLQGLKQAFAEMFECPVVWKRWGILIDNI